MTIYEETKAFIEEETGGKNARKNIWMRRSVNISTTAEACCWK